MIFEMNVDGEIDLSCRIFGKTYYGGLILGSTEFDGFTGVL
jgi:hypothetical protein